MSTSDYTPTPRCIAPGCERTPNGYGLCERHLSYFTRYGAFERPPLPTIAERFWAKVDKSGACWIWRAGICRAGYGTFGIPGRGTQYAHRLAWEYLRGPIPEGLFVLHNCPGGDNRRCVNPDHLFLGTSLDNMRDMISKGRQGWGSRPKNAKLTEDQVREIRRRVAQGEMQSTLASEIGITRATICHVVRRVTWKDVD